MNKIITFLVVGLCVLGSNSHAQIITILSGDGSGCQGQICLPITTQDFTNVRGMQFSMHWDPTVVQFDNVVIPPPPPFMPGPVNGLPNLSEASFNTFGDETLTLSWDKQSHPFNVEVVDGSTIFEVCFEITGSIGSTSPFFFDSNPTAQELLIDEADGSITQYSDQIAFDEGVIFLVDDGSPECGTPDNGFVTIEANPTNNCSGEVCLPVSVNNFKDIFGMQYAMHWDPNILTYDHVNIPESPPFTPDPITSLPNLFSSNFNLFDNQSLIFSWDKGNHPFALELIDGSVIYEVCFTVNANANVGDISAFFFDGNPVSIEFTTEEAGMPLPPTQDYNLVNSNIAILDPNSPECLGAGTPALQVNIENGAGFPDESVCLPVRVNNFTDITEFSWQNTWNANILTFSHVQNLNSSISLGLSNFSTVNINNGELGVAWDSNMPMSLPIGSLLYEMCFDITGDSGASSVGLANNPAPQALDADGMDIGVNSSDGQFTVSNPDGFSISVQDVFACPTDSSHTCVPLVARGLNNMLGFQWTIEYNTDVLQVKPFVFAQGSDRSVVNGHPELYPPPNGDVAAYTEFNETSPGVISYSFASPGLVPRNVPNGEIIYAVCFDIVGELGDVTPIEITGSEATIEGTQQPNPPDPTIVQIPIDVFPGEVAISCGPPPSIDLNASTVTDVDCNGNSTGAIEVVINNGAMPFTYAWSDQAGATTKDRTNLTANTYTITVTDADGITATGTFNVGQPDLILGITTVTNTSNSNVNDGAITLNVTGGLAPFSYQWSNNASTQNINGLSAGIYTVTITDDNNCTATATAEVAVTLTAGNPVESTTQNPPAGSTIVQNVRCLNANDGAITLGVNGGAPPYTYIWDDNMTTKDRSGLSPGTYCVTISEANGQTASGCYSIQQPTAALQVTFSTSLNEGVNGVTQDGTFEINVNGGWSPYSFSWEGPGNYTSGAEDLFNINAGDYSVTVTDANGCTVSMSGTVGFDSNPLAINQQNSAITPVGCFGACTGGITVAVTGGEGPYEYQWSSPGNGQSISGLCAGITSVTVTDATGTMVSSSFTVGQPAQGVTLDAVVTPTDTPTSSNGQINLSVSGGTPNYTYSWSNQANTQDIQNLAVGTYIVTVTDANNCTQTGTYDVNPAAPPLIINGGASVMTDASCFGFSDGVIEPEIEGGLEPYTYQWSNNATTRNLNGIPAGNYTITITDAFGTTATETFIIAQPTQIVINATVIPESTSGGDGAITLSISGGTPGYSYIWSGPGSFSSTSKDISNLNSGNYAVTVTDTRGCTSVGNYNISRIFGIANVDITDNPCFGECEGSITLETVGGTPPYQWTWNGPNNVSFNVEDINGLCAGTWCVTIVDDAGGVDTDCYIIEEPSSAITITDQVITAHNGPMPNGMINLTVTGGTPGYQYEWSHDFEAQQDPIDLEGDNTYQVNITDANGCVLVSPEYFVPYIPLPLDIASVNITDLDCFGDDNGVVSFTIDGGDNPYDIAWSGTQTGSVSLATQNTYSITDLSAGDVTITVTDNNGQEIVITRTVDSPDALAIMPTITNDTNNCNGGINLNGTGTTGGTPIYSYDWSGPPGFGSPSSPSIGDLCQGEYYVTITDANECAEAFGPLEVVIDAPLLFIDAGQTVVNGVLCPGDTNGSIDLMVMGGYGNLTYNWNVNEFDTEDLSNLGVGTYTVVITDEVGQSTEEVFEITAVSELQILSAFATSAYSNGFNISTFGACDGSASIIADAGSVNIESIVWDDGAFTGANVTGLCGGEHTVVVTDTWGCSMTETIIVTEPVTSGPLSVEMEVLSSCEADDRCNGEAMVIPSGGTPPYSYDWSIASIGDFPMVTDLCPGTYSVTVSDQDGTAIATELVIEAIILEIDFINVTPPSDMLSDNGSAQAVVSGGSGSYSYQWNNDTNCPTALCDRLTEGQHWVVVIDEDNGCEDTQSVLVGLEDIPCSDIRNVITPDGDGLNETFQIGCAIDFENTLEIYNRWGQLVFETTNYENDWDARNRRGEELPEGAYFYVLVLQLEPGNSQQMKGHITVLRE